MTRSTDCKPAPLTRRSFLRRSAVASTGLAAALLARHPPAFAQERRVHWLARSDFIPPADRKIEAWAKEFEAATGVKLQLEFINANDLPARATAAVESGTGPDIIQLLYNYPHLYASRLIDHTALCRELGVDKPYPALRGAAEVDGVFRGVPFKSVGITIAYRKDLFDKLGIPDPQEQGTAFTWPRYLEAARKLKQAGTPVGQTMGHTFADAPAFCYPFLWSFGGRERDERGQVAINSKETREAVEFLREFWREGCDESAFAWDDTSNNRAFLAGTLGATLNGASIYFEAHNRPEKYPALPKDSIRHVLLPYGPAGRFSNNVDFTHSILRSSKQQEAAKDWLRFLMEKKRYEEYVVMQQGYITGVTPDWEQHPFWKQLPVVAPFRECPKYARNFGWAGPYDRKAGEVYAKYIVIDLFSSALQGKSTNDAIAQAERELKLVYGRA